MNLFTLRYLLQVPHYYLVNGRNSKKIIFYLYYLSSVVVSYLLPAHLKAVVSVN